MTAAEESESDSKGSSLSPPLSPTPPDAEEYGVRRTFQRIYRAGTRGFLIGFALRGGLHAVSTAVQLSKGKRARRVHSRKLCADTLRWAAAVATFGSVYVGVDEGLRATLGNERCEFEPRIAKRVMRIRTQYCRARGANSSQGLPSDGAWCRPSSSLF